MNFREYMNESPSSDIMLKSLISKLKKSGYKTKIVDNMKSKTVEILNTKYKVSVGGVFAGKYTLFETIGTNVNELKSYEWNNIGQLIGAIS